MPRKAHFGLDHVKSVKRNGVTYLYFNTGEKDEKKRAIYTPLGRKGDPQVGANYTAALQARSRRSGLPTSLTVPQLVRRFHNSADFTKKSDGTQRVYLIYLNRLGTEFDCHPAGGLETSELYELMDEMSKTPAAVDMLLMVGNQMYEWALKRKLVRHNPFEPIDREDWEQNAYKPWPDSVVEEALQDARLKVPVALLYFTAQRIGDCCKARWDDLEAPKANPGELYVEQEKTGKELWIPLHGRLNAILVEAPRRGETILADEKGRPRKKQTIRLWIKEFGEARGVDLVPHGLRKNAVNALLEAECSTAETASISGQSLRMVEHYAAQRNSRRMGRRAIDKWEQFGHRENSGKTQQESADL